MSMKRTILPIAARCGLVAIAMSCAGPAVGPGVIQGKPVILRDVVHGKTVIPITKARWASNGEFLLRSNKIGQLTGDGADEVTHWTFDFSPQDLHPVGFGDHVMREARLSLGVTSYGETDPRLLIHGLSELELKDFLILPGNGDSATLTFDLIGDVGLSPAVLNKLLSTWGLLRMRLSDDYLLHEARIEIVYESLVPSVGTPTP